MGCLYQRMREAVIARQQEEMLELSTPVVKLWDGVRPHHRHPQADRCLARTQGGLGLGLALVRGLVELHGGRVTARSEGPNLGAEFVVVLPLVQGPSCERAAAVPARLE